MPDDPSLEFSLNYLQTKAAEIRAALPMLQEFLGGYMKVVESTTAWASMELALAQEKLRAREQEIMLVRVQAAAELAGLVYRLKCYRFALDYGYKVIPMMFPCGGTEGFIKPSQDDEVLGCCCHADFDRLAEDA
jgi:hypothetical protein